MKNNYLFKFLRYIKYEKKNYAISFVIILLLIAVELLSYKVITNVFSNEFTSISKTSIFNEALKIAAIYFVLKILNVIFYYLKSYMLVKAANNIHCKIQENVYDHVQNLKMSYFESVPSGTILSKITTDVRNINIFFKVILVQVFVFLLEIIIILLIMFKLQYKLTLMFFMLIPLIYIFQKIYINIVYPYQIKIRKENAKCSGIANELLQNLEIIRIYNNEENTLKLWEEHAKQRLKFDKKALILESFFVNNIQSLLNPIINLTIILFFLYSNYKIKDSMTSDVLLLFLFYMGRILSIISNITANMVTYTKALGSAKNIYDLLELESISKDKKKEIKDFKGSINFKNVYFAYNEDEYVLKDINLCINENETIAFVGHTGSGKSTIMNLLIKFYEYQKGEILVSGEKIENIDTNFLRDKMSIVLQDSFLFEDGLLENISEDKNKAIEALKLVGASYILEERGLNEKVSVNGSNFSAGEKQLISFARALVKNPKILILDEATSSIDSKTENIIQKGLEVLRKNRTTLIIAHRLSTIKNADRIVVLDKGNIVEVGTHNELISKNGLYKKYIEKEVKDK